MSAEHQPPPSPRPEHRPARRPARAALPRYGCSARPWARCCAESVGPDLFDDVERLRRAVIDARNGEGSADAPAAIVAVVRRGAGRAGGQGVHRLLPAGQPRRGAPAGTGAARAQRASDRPDSFSGIVGRLTPEQLAELLPGLEVHPVLTAHPTEARRRAAVTAIHRVGEAIDLPDDGRARAPAARGDHRAVAHRPAALAAARARSTRSARRWRSSTSRCSRWCRRSTARSRRRWPAPTPAPSRRPSRRTCGSAAGSAATATATPTSPRRSPARRSTSRPTTCCARSPTRPSGWPTTLTLDALSDPAVGRAASPRPSGPPTSTPRSSPGWPAARTSRTATTCSTSPPGCGATQDRHADLAYRGADEFVADLRLLQTSLAAAGAGAGRVRRRAGPALAGRDVRLPPRRARGPPALRAAHRGAGRYLGDDARNSDGPRPGRPRGRRRAGDAARRHVARGALDDAGDRRAAAPVGRPRPATATSSASPRARPTWSPSARWPASPSATGEPLELDVVPLFETQEDLRERRPGARGVADLPLDPGPPRRQRQPGRGDARLLRLGQGRRPGLGDALAVRRPGPARRVGAAPRHRADALPRPRRRARPWRRPGRTRDPVRRARARSPAGSR